MPLIKSPSKAALSKNIATEMDSNPSPSKRKQNIAIAYSVKRQAMKKKKMAEGGELTANDESESMNSADARTKREMAMSMGNSMMDGDELEATHESMPGNSIDDATSMREMAMMKRRKMAQGGEITVLQESMPDNSIDEASDERDMNMLDSKPTRHKDELLARDIGHPGEDSEDDMEMSMLHTQNQPDEYSKAGRINYAKGGKVSDGIMRKRMMAEGGEVDLQNNADEQLNEEDQLSFQAPRKKTYYDNSQISSQPEDSNMHGDSEESDAENEHDMTSEIRKRMKSKRMI